MPATGRIAVQIGGRTVVALQLFLAGFSAAGQSATPSPVTAKGVPLALERVGHVVVLNRVYLNGAGPFRMMIDTGNASSLVRPEVARRLSLRPVFAVEQITVTGVRTLPVAKITEMTAGLLRETSLEVIIGDIRMDGIDGVLGQSWLARHDYLLDYQNRRIVIDGVEPDHGISMPFHSTDGRPVVSIEVDGLPRDLVLDSGAPSLVLFECKPPRALQATAKQVLLLSDSGSTTASMTRAKITLPGGHTLEMSAVCVGHAGSGEGNGTGLLPASVFQAIFVSNHDRGIRLLR